MTKKVWSSDAISIILLPSGRQGEEILELALQWSRSWLLTPALWMLADSIPDFDPEVDIELQVPPNLTAFLLGRDLVQNPVKEEVDVFWTLGSQAFKTIRFIAVRTEQDAASMKRTSIAAETASKFVERAVPASLGTYKKYNLVVAPTNERKVLDGVLSQYWDANLIAAAEDRATPASSDSFVKVAERFTGFALAHIATTAGLWAGLPISSAEINSTKNQLNQARLQRVFVRGVTSDSLSADVAHWALQKLNHSDTNLELGLVEGRKVRTIASEYQEPYMNQLVEYILRGPSNEHSQDNFLYQPFEESRYAPHKDTWFKRLMVRIQDMAIGLGSLPRWVGALAEYRMDYALDGEHDDEILYKAAPERLAPKVKLPPIDVLVASLKPKLPMPTPDLWRHMRESISSAIDAPTPNHPLALIDPKDERFLVFATIDQVLPNPDAFWEGDQYSSGTSVKFERVDWLDASTAQGITSGINKRIDELAPGIVDARQQLSETQKLVDDAKNELGIVDEDLDLIQKELESDQLEAKKSRNNHTHKLPRAVTEKAKRKSEGAIGTVAPKPTHGRDLEDFLASDEERKSKRGFFKRLFSRKNGKKK